MCVRQCAATVRLEDVCSTAYRSESPNVREHQGGSLGRRVCKRAERGGVVVNADLLMPRLSTLKAGVAVCRASVMLLGRYYQDILVSSSRSDMAYEAKSLRTRHTLCSRLRDVSWMQV